MKEIYKLFRNVVERLLRRELKSNAGKVNLVGGLLVIAMAALIFAQDTLLIVLNGVLSYFGKPLLPTINDLYILAFFVFILLYFYLCVRVISKSDY